MAKKALSQAASAETKVVAQTIAAAAFGKISSKVTTEETDIFGESSEGRSEGLSPIRIFANDHVTNQTTSVC